MTTPNVLAVNDLHIVTNDYQRPDQVHRLNRWVYSSRGGVRY